jgi:hypothetical protein
MFAGYNNVTANSNWTTVPRLAVPTAVVTAGPLTYVNQMIGTTSALQTVTVANTGLAGLSISSVALTTGTNYTIVNNGCSGSPKVVAPEANCTIDIAFKPTATGALTDTLTITDNTGNIANSKQTVSLTGTGTAPVANLSAIQPFGSLLVGSTSAVQPLTLTNSGDAPLTINSIIPPAQFAQTNNCGASLPVGSSCTISITYKPTAAGAASGDLVFTDNSNGVANSVQKVTLSGTGVAPATPVITAALSALPPVNVAMSWTASSTVALQPDSYQVQRTAASANVALNCATAAYNNLGLLTNVASAGDTTVVANKTYCYRVVATNTAGTYTSVGARVTTPAAAPAAPTLPIISNVTQTSLTFGWTAGAGTVALTGYQVQVCQGLAATGNCAATGAGWASLGTVPSGTNSLAVTGLTAGTSYLFRVQAYNPLTSAWLTSGATAYPVAIADLFTATSNTTATQNVTGNVLTNDLPTSASGRTVTNVSAITHTTGGGANPATATVTFTATGAMTVVLTSPAANTTPALKQASKRGTYTFTYTETLGSITTAPVTVTLTVN